MMRPSSRVAIFGDDGGIPMLLQHLAASQLACAVIAGIRDRPERLLCELEARGIPVLVQPRRTSADYEKFVTAFAATRPDTILCNSYSMKIGGDVLAMVDGNAINAHGALLPRNRGPNPIQWAIIRGETSSGVTLHYMSDEIDAGDIVAQREVSIAANDTWVTVRDKVNVALREVIAAEVPRIIAGENARTPQDAGSATVNPRLTPDSPRIDFSRMLDEEIYNLVRAQVRPLAGAYLELSGGERRYFPEMLAMNDIAQLRVHWSAL